MADPISPLAEPPTLPTPVASTSMTPVLHRVAWHRHDLDDTATIALQPIDEHLPPPLAGQFHMLWVPGVGEIPISVSGVDGDGRVEHTIRSVGAVSRALATAEAGTLLGVRGPFGRPWDLDAARDRHLLVVAGGLGIAPLRPVVEAAAADPARHRSVRLLVGTRHAAGQLWPDQLDGWGRSVDVRRSADTAPTGWSGTVGPITRLLPGALVDPGATEVLVCGPEIMMRIVAERLVDAGVAAGAVQVSLERNMHCGVGQCGHCQLGARFLCVDGPILTWAECATDLGVRER